MFLAVDTNIQNIIHCDLASRAGKAHIACFYYYQDYNKIIFEELISDLLPELIEAIQLAFTRNISSILYLLFIPIARYKALPKYIFSVSCKKAKKFFICNRRKGMKTKH